MIMEVFLKSRKEWVIPFYRIFKDLLKENWERPSGWLVAKFEEV